MNSSNESKAKFILFFSLSTGIPNQNNTENIVNRLISNVDDDHINPKFFIMLLLFY